MKTVESLQTADLTKINMLQLQDKFVTNFQTPELMKYLSENTLTSIIDNNDRNCDQDDLNLNFNQLEKKIPSKYDSDLLIYCYIKETDSISMFKSGSLLKRKTINNKDHYLSREHARLFINSVGDEINIFIEDSSLNATTINKNSSKEKFGGVDTSDNNKVDKYRNDTKNAMENNEWKKSTEGIHLKTSKNEIFAITMGKTNLICSANEDRVENLQVGSSSFSKKAYMILDAIKNNKDPKRTLKNILFVTDFSKEILNDDDQSVEQKIQQEKEQIINVLLEKLNKINGIDIQKVHQMISHVFKTASINEDFYKEDIGIVNEQENFIRGLLGLIHELNLHNPQEINYKMQKEFYDKAHEFLDDKVVLDEMKKRIDDFYNYFPKNAFLKDFFIEILVEKSSNPKWKQLKSDLNEINNFSDQDGFRNDKRHEIKEVLEHFRLHTMTL